MTGRCRVEKRTEVQSEREAVPWRSQSEVKNGAAVAMVTAAPETAMAFMSRTLLRSEQSGMSAKSAMRIGVMTRQYAALAGLGSGHGQARGSSVSIEGPGRASARFGALLLSGSVKLDREREVTVVAAMLTVLDRTAIMALIPHRPPMLYLVSAEVVPGIEGVGIFNLEAVRPLLEGHFPGHPVVPGTQLLEGMEQLAAVVVLAATGGNNFITLLREIEGVRFFHQVRPESQVVLTAKVLSREDREATVEVRALVEGKIVAQATITGVLLRVRNRGAE